MDSLDIFLRESKFCNYSDPLITEKAAEITNGITDPTEKALALFYWVRDNIHYRVAFWNRTAVQTLKEGQGTCTNSANLLVTFLRCCNIPAGYGVMTVNGKEYLGPVVLPLMKNFIAEVSTHVYATVFLNGKWIRIDPSDDQEFCKNTSYLGPPYTLTDWDGINHADIELNPEYIYSDRWPLADITDIIGKPYKNSVTKHFILKMGNVYIHFLRHNTVRATSKAHLQTLFLNYLKKNNPLYYTFFRVTDAAYRAKSNRLFKRYARDLS